MVNLIKRIGTGAKNYFCFNDIKEWLKLKKEREEIRGLKYSLSDKLSDSGIYVFRVGSWLLDLASIYNFIRGDYGYGIGAGVMATAIEIEELILMPKSIKKWKYENKKLLEGKQTCEALKKQ
jgi:hypothetical protein